MVYPRAYDNAQIHIIITYRKLGMKFHHIAEMLERHTGERKTANGINNVITRIRNGTLRPQPPGPAPAESTRTCLSCLQPFESEWIGNRRCLRCKNSAAYRGGI